MYNYYYYRILQKDMTYLLLCFSFIASKAPPYLIRYKCTLPCEMYYAICQMNSNGKFRLKNVLRFFHRFSLHVFEYKPSLPMFLI